MLSKTTKASFLQILKAEMNQLVVGVKNFASYSCNNRVDPKAEPTETRIKVLQSLFTVHMKTLR